MPSPRSAGNRRRVNVALFWREDRQSWYARFPEPGKASLTKRSLGLPREQKRVARAECEKIRLELEVAFQRHGSLKWFDAVQTYLMSIHKVETKRTWIRCALRWADTLGEGRYLSEITPDVVHDHVLRRRRQGVKDATIRLELGLMSAVFNFHGITPDDNPIRRYRISRVKKPQKVTNPLSPRDEQRLLDACTHDVHRRMIIFAIETGLRKAEQYTLRPDDVDLRAGEIVLPGERTKSGRPRMVFLNRRAVEAIAGHYRPDDPVVFMTPRGRPFDALKASPTWWRTIKRRAGVECRWHDLRHTFATRWVRNGGDLATLKELLGHERIDMTMRYAHLAKDGVKHQVALMDERRSGQNEGGRGIFLSPESVPGAEVRKP